MTTVAGVPTQLALMLRDPEFDAFDLGSVQHIVAGGGPLTPGLAEEARRRFGAKLATRYSCTEAGIGLGTSEAVAVAAMIGPAQVGARVLDWKLARDMSPVTSARLGAGLLPVGVASVLLGAPGLMFALAYGMSNGIMTINKGTLPMHLFGPHGYATRLGRLALPALIAQAVTPTVLAPLIDTLPAIWIFGAMGGVALLAFACLIPMKR